MSDLQKIKEARLMEQYASRENDQDTEEKGEYKTALDISEADEISLEKLCEKIEVALESEKWQIANSFSNEILRRDPKYAKAYLYKLLAERKVFHKTALANLETPFDDSDNYRLLIRFADVYLKTEIESYSEKVKLSYQARTIEARYQALCNKLAKAYTGSHYQEVANGFRELGNYKDSIKRATECLEKSKKAISKERRRPILKKVAIVAVILAVVLGIVGFKMLKAASYKAELFVVEVTEKVNVYYDDNKVYCVFKINIINNSKYNANYLKGYITISDAEGTVLASGSAWFTGVIASQNKNYHELDLDFDRGGVGERIWNADLSDLVVTFRITEIRFENGTQKEYSEKDVVVNK